MDPVVDQDDTRMESGPHGKLDVMNDPAYDTNVKSKQNSSEEPDTCRICRGEGSKEEPLFYPCKCSGSIKFVHQSCLMEWLSHSQKKYCELCKTPFHFTKLYHPQMPNTVPLPVFLRQAAVHVWKSMVTSSRFLLVIFVWAAWLPWCMRTIWRGLFWIGDGAWVNWTEREFLNEAMNYSLSARLAAEGMTPAKQGLLTSKEATASAFVTQLSSKLPRFIPPADKLFTFSSGQPWSFLLLKKVYFYLIGEATAPLPPSTSVAANLTRHDGPVSRSSWLSEFQFLKTLTPSTMLNNMLVDALEGQLITFFVVTAFILVFLIREWVVQQQPIINGGINLNAEGAAARNADPHDQRQADEQVRHVPEGGAAGEPVDEGLHAQGPRARMIVRARQRRPRDTRRLSEQEGFPTEESPVDIALNNLGENQGPGISDQPPRTLDESSHAATSESSSEPPQRPGMPDRDTLARAAEIRRTIEEHSGSPDAKDSAMETFKDLWIRAGREPMEVISILEQEGRSDELGWVVAAMRKIEGVRQEAKSDQEEVLSTAQEGRDHTSSRQSESEDGFILLHRSSKNSSPEPSSQHHANPSSPVGSDLNTFLPNPTQASDNEATETGAETHVDSNQQNYENRIAPLTEVGQDPSASHYEEQTEEVVNTNAPVPSANPAFNNSFHPQYEGDLPEATDYPRATSPSHESVSQETIRSNPTSVESPNSQTQNPAAPEVPDQTLNVIEIVTDWLWGGVTPIPVSQEQPAGDDEHVVNDIADEAPFVAVDHGQPLPLAANDRAVANQDPDVVAAAIQAGVNPNEADAAEEIEDLEGILELIGMQGPLAGLVQNGMFCACLVSLTIVFGVWVPYIAGKLLLVLLAHPVSLLFRIPLRWAASSADTIIDLFIFCASCAFYWTDASLRLMWALLGLLAPTLGKLSQPNPMADISRSYAESALERLANTFIATGGVLSETDIPMFSVIAHESLRSFETKFAWAVRGLCDRVAAISETAHQSSSFVDFSRVLTSNMTSRTKVIASTAIERVSSILSLWPSLLHVNPLRINIALPQRTIPLDYDLAYWNTKDRALAIVFGYLFFALIGVSYLHLSSRVKGTNKNGRVGGGLADALYQAGGVVKVILIISIEMIAFPLYCGLLLDVALLPLFGGATIASRVNFTLTSPNTSLFVHWFVGTCYMFHFALFVSMCRKILRSGVLYFIRDPDDPTFHPVRDVLERSVSTQLWKISFSALVYGGLVIVCLGGVVWGIGYTFDGVFPIHWSSNEPILEFPVDLLFYNFLMPLAVKFLKPSKALNRIFSWWFRKCARALRLTCFLFGEEKAGSEGTHAEQIWASMIRGDNSDVQNSRIEDSQQASTNEGTVEATSPRDGKFVRAPGSDQVRIPRGSRTFLEVDENNNRIDGLPDHDDGLHGRKNEMFTKVYIPPMFRVRISAFVFLIWVFAAATGISMTVVPLVFGRWIFATLAPSHLRMNDIYAFSIGVYILGGALYGILQRRRVVTYIRDTLTPHTTTITSFIRQSASLTLRILSLLYIYTAFGILLPALLSVVMEFYLIIPIHTYFSTTFASLDLIQSERHIIHLIQDWTLGVLYLKMAARLILWYTPSRPATALRAIVRNGWFNPDVQLATRGFIIPATLLISLALALPLALGYLANATILHSLSANNELFRACVYRYSYPGVLGLGFVAASVWMLGRAFSGWRKKVRDEVYLIGERLHNFGEGKRKRAGGGKGKGKERERERDVAVEGQA